MLFWLLLVLLSPNVRVLCERTRTRRTLVARLTGGSRAEPWTAWTSLSKPRTLLALVCLVIVLFLIAERGAGIGGVANLLKVWFKGHSVAFRAGVHGCWISIDEDSEFDASADSGMDSASVLSRARNRVKGISS